MSPTPSQARRHVQCEMHHPTTERCLALPAPSQIPLTQFKQNNQGNDPLGESHQGGHSHVRPASAAAGCVLPWQGQEAAHKLTAHLHCVQGTCRDKTSAPRAPVACPSPPPVWLTIRSTALQTPVSPCVLGSFGCGPESSDIPFPPPSQTAASPPPSSLPPPSLPPPSPTPAVPLSPGACQTNLRRRSGALTPTTPSPTRPRQALTEQRAGPHQHTPSPGPTLQVS